MEPEKLILKYMCKSKGQKPVKKGKIKTTPGAICMAFLYELLSLKPEWLH